MREAEEALSRLRGIAGGTLNVAVISAGNYFFPGLLAAFQQRQPNVAITLKVNNRDELLRNCPLLTSEAADGRTRGDIGGTRINKKKKK